MYRNLTSLEDTFKAIRELQDFWDNFNSQNVDFHQRQIKNAHPSIDDYDYVVRKELKDDVDKAQEDTHKKVADTLDTSIVDGRYLRTFGYGIGRNLSTGSDLLPPLIIPFAATKLEKIYFKCKTAPVGQAAIANIKKGGTTILLAARLNVPDGSIAVQTVASFATVDFVENDVLTFDMDQVGTTTPGSTLVVTLRFKVVTI